eukprot:TRINITY_DN3203_c0_g1_i2.p1 TRINITY_DN3203_c0_g1~~TRINITY_DN3203_c0_g1_i2.p1  ORF type:complete len:378 (-),score=61.72 TRINITY_DN3203_c0_g1_i2:1364-2497(-)
MGSQLSRSRSQAEQTGGGQESQQQQAYQPPTRFRPFRHPASHTQTQPHYPPPPTPQSAPQQSVKTTTIKSQVNLRKKTLKVQLSEDKERLIVSFQFDAVVPCSVTTFFGATEMPKEGNRLISGVQGIGERIYYPEKSQFNSAHAFPPPQQEELDRAHELNLKLFEPEILQPPMDSNIIRRDTYPIIIRLECLSENSDTHTLEELLPGESLPKWVQAQTTYAVLRQDNDNTERWQVQVVKQKIWVSGSAYVLQDLYGIEGGVSPSSHQNQSGNEADDLDSGRECVICLTALRDTAVLPCRHFCMCQDCAKEVYKTSRQCPICRIKAGSLLQIRMENKHKKNEEQGSGIVEEEGEAKVDVNKVQEATSNQTDQDGFVQA